MNAVTFNGRTVFLLTEMPDWGTPIQATFDLPVAAEVGLSNRETRRPLGTTLRVKMTFSLTLEGPAAHQLTDGLRQWQDELVAVPFWPGAVPWSERAGAPFSAGWNVAVSLDGTQQEIWDTLAPAWPAANDWHAPLLLGRLVRHEPTWLAGGVCQFTVDFSEASPASNALVVDAVVWGAGPVPSVAWGIPPRLLPFRVDFREPALGSVVEVEQERVGLGREDAVTFYTQSNRREGTAGLILTPASDIAALVRFFSEHGAGEPFWAPLWPTAARLTADVAGGATSLAVVAGHAFEVGDWLALNDQTSVGFAKVLTAGVTSLDLDRAPGAFAASNTVVVHLALVRCERPKLSVEWASAEIARASFAVRELPAEYLPAADEFLGVTLGRLPVRAYLYDVTLAVEGAPIVERFTSFERDLVADGNTYLAAKLEHDAIRQGVILDRDEVELRAVPDTTETSGALMRLATIAADWPVLLTIRYVDLPS